MREVNPLVAFFGTFVACLVALSLLMTMAPDLIGKQLSMAALLVVFAAFHFIILQPQSQSLKKRLRVVGFATLGSALGCALAIISFRSFS